MTPLVVGLTGGIGAGKSTVAELLAARGASVIDVDGLGRAVLEPGGGAYHGVVETFGRRVVGPDGEIDRAALASVVFGPQNRLAELEAISHPAINEVLAGLVRAETAAIVVLDMAVLAESKLGQTAAGALYRRVVVVEAPVDVRIPRLVARGLTEGEARDRMAAQASDHDRRRLADLIVPNGGSRDELAAFVASIWATFEAWATQSGEAATP